MAERPNREPVKPEGTPKGADTEEVADGLKKIPGVTQGVRSNSAMRMLKMVRPICPNSKLKMVRDEERKWIPAEDQPVNCQRADVAKWWEYCEAQGHKPYEWTRVWYELQDRIEIDPETGDEIVLGVKRIRHVSTRPNIVQVAVALRINNGMGAVDAKNKKGFKRLEECGYEEVCQFRNCQREIHYISRKYGAYCSEEHIQLIAADAEGVLLNYVDVTFNGDKTKAVASEREKKLREVGAFAVDRRV